MKDLLFYRTPEHECSYITGYRAQTLFVDPEAEINEQIHETLSLAGFRRSGDHIYRPDCRRCHQCQSARVVVQDFRWTRSFRRILKTNDDLTVEMKAPYYSGELYDLYSSYLESRHSDGDMYPPTPELFRSFLAESPVRSYFLEYRDQNRRLICCSVADWLQSGPSAVYTFFAPDEHRRSPGTLAVLMLIQIAGHYQLPYVYLGYWIPDSPKMSYKTRFQPLQLFRNNHWENYKNP